MRKRAVRLAAAVAASAVLVPAAWAQEVSPPAEEPAPVDSPTATPTEEPAPTPTPSPSDPPDPTPDPTPPPTTEPPTTDPDPTAPTPAPTEPSEPEDSPPADDAPLPDGPVEVVPEEGETEEEAAERAAAIARAWVRSAAAQELQRASARAGEFAQQLSTAEAELASAQTQRDILLQAQGSAEGEEGAARRALGNYARLAYTSGPSEWTWIEAFLEASGPQDAMRRASASQLLAERQNTEWSRAVDLVAALTAEREAAEDRVAAAESAVAWSREQAEPTRRQIEALRWVTAAGGIALPYGAQAVARECAGAAIPQCEPSGWGEGSLTRDAVWLMRVIKQEWPEIDVVGGFRAADKYADHPTGRAVDVMVPDGGATAASAALGDEMAEYFVEHADRYGILYILWRQRVWVNGRDEPLPVEEWRPMEDRGGATVNHYDHLHISVSTGVSGSDIYSVIAAADDGE